ncbi:MAG TPA: hypothetical protein VLJ62_28445 [Burkholderiaceae bacterium]|nr:hypothetical protein [Burkholderiaceae bacterium]
MSLVYRRRDVVLDIQPAGGDARFTLTRPDGGRSQAWLKRRVLDQAADGNPAALVWALTRIAAAKRQDATGTGIELTRVCLQLGHREWARIDWEGLTRLPDACFVRSCPVRPRVAQIPLTFPIRILEAGGEPVVEAALRDVFGESDRSLAIVTEFVPPAAVASHPGTAGWPTVDVLHLRGQAAGATPLQWLPRYLDTWQTRLLILECTPADRAASLQLAQTLVERGGPAVFVVDQGTLKWAGWDGFYAHVVHDRPLDWIRSRVKGGALFAGALREELLRYSLLAKALAKPAAAREIVGGMGTRQPPRRGPRSTSGTVDLTGIARAAVERATRSLLVPVVAGSGTPLRLDFRGFDRARRVRFTSLVAADLSERGVNAAGVERAFRSALARPDQSLDGDRLASAIARSAVSVHALDADGAAAAVQTRLRSISGMSSWLRYEDHESEGMLPLAAKVADARALLRQFGRPRASRARAARHINAAFFAVEPAGRLRKLPPAAARLRAGELVHLGVQIGERDRLLAAIGSTALIEELDRQPQGIWLEIGVTAYDFELIGDPVQPLWLPRSGESELATFALRVPGTTPNEGVARLRFSIYHRHNVVQSFLVAARLDGPGTSADARLAAVLGVRPSRIEALGRPSYVTRLEYRARSLGEAGDAGERALSIVANDNAGQKVLTFKGEELFHVSSNADVEDLVVNVREALDRASQDSRQQYLYTHGNELNRGNPDDLLNALWDVALTGWQLFDQLVPGEAQQRAVLDRLSNGLGLHAAHIDLTKVIPWALVYDRPLSERKLIADPFNPGAKEQEVTRALCRAALPALDGSVHCGGPGCLLHPSENKRRYAQGEPLLCEETVVCPQRFWGFRVPIEVPVQQVHGVAGNAPPPIRTQIASAQPLVFVAALNPNLDKRMLGDTGDGAHAQKLRELVARANGRFVPPPRNDRDAIIDLLAEEQPDVVYFYCHGVAGRKTASGRKLGDCLDFGPGHPDQVAELIESSALRGKDWTHGPLVFLNGCNTAGFRPYAPSTFIEKLIKGCKASAVIGTEVTVWEALAREFAETYFGAMLATRQPGESLLIARRALMAKDNPLGLVYTLYGSLDLKA